MSGEPSQPTPPSIFLSYAREDRAKAQAVVAALEAQGLAIWWDGLLEGGHEFSDKIEQALASADVVVVLWSPASVHSHWVRDEAASGRDRGRMIPVTIGGAEPPLGFRQIQHIDLTKWRGGLGGKEIERLYRAICNVSAEPHPDFRQPARSPPVEFSRRNMMIAGAAGVAVLGGSLVGFTRLTGGSSREISIGVLPFRNLSGNSAEEYFSDGIAEELRATLSQSSDLAVAADTSSDVAQKKSSEPRAIASALGVTFLLEGSIRREANMVRIAAHIVDGSTGFDKWSQTFDRKLDDILAVQSEIAAFVTDALLSGIAAAKRPRDRLGGTRNNDAFDAYLRGLALYKLAGGEASDFAALKDFQRAVALDPNYAVAQAALSRAYTVIANGYARAGQVKEFHEKAVNSARAAMRVAPRLADGYSALGFVLLNGELDPSGAAAAYQRSFDLGYGNADILASYASFASRTGRFADGRVAIARAQRLDPLNSTVFRTARAARAGFAPLRRGAGRAAHGAVAQSRCEHDPSCAWRHRLAHRRCQRRARPIWKGARRSRPPPRTGDREHEIVAGQTGPGGYGRAQGQIWRHHLLPAGAGAGAMGTGGRSADVPGKGGGVVRRRSGAFEERPAT